MAPLALILIIVFIVLAAMYYMSKKGSSSCGCNKRDPVYLDDPVTNLDTPDQYRDEFLNSKMAKLV